MSGLVAVTTAEGPTDTQLARAHGVADRCGVPVVRRRGPVPAGLHYVVGRGQEWLVDGAERIAVHEGMLRPKLTAGTGHPLIRALAPDGQASRVIDGTLGLAGDALHIAAALGCVVDACEASPAVFSLAEAGLLAVSGSSPAAADAASRVRIHAAVTAQWLAGQPYQSADAVFMAPMFREPRKAAPGYALFRAIAVHRPFGADDLAQARRVGRRVVVKGIPGDPPPPVLAGLEVASIRGKRLQYWVVNGG